MKGIINMEILLVCILFPILVIFNAHTYAWPGSCSSLLGDILSRLQWSPSVISTRPVAEPHPAVDYGQPRHTHTHTHTAEWYRGSATLRANSQPANHTHTHRHRERESWHWHSDGNRNLTGHVCPSPSATRKGTQNGLTWARDQWTKLCRLQSLGNVYELCDIVGCPDVETQDRCAYWMDHCQVLYDDNEHDVGVRRSGIQSMQPDYLRERDC